MNIRKWIFVILCIFLFPFVVKAETYGNIPNLTQNINVALDCEKCFLKDDILVRFQLFVGDEPIDGYYLILSKENDYKGVFNNLPVYYGETGEEIPFSVKYYDDGTYHDLEDDEIASKTVKISKWVQVLPKDITSGHDYILLSSGNVLNRSNDFTAFALNYDLSTIDVDVEAYNVYSPENNNSVPLYALLNDPPESMIWRFEEVTHAVKAEFSLAVADYTNIYGYFKNYNNDYLSLVGDAINYRENFYFTPTTKLGWNESEQAIYERSLKLSAYDDKFIISSYIDWDQYLPVTEKANLASVYRSYDIKYLGLGSERNVITVDDSEDANFFVAFEKVEDQEFRLLDLQVTKKMCTGDQTEITLSINSSKSLTTIFDNMDDLDLVRDCVIEDETIAKIEDGKIIPLAVGKTEIIVNYKDNQYRIVLNVTEDDLINGDVSIDDEEPLIENPHTGAILPIGISLLIIGAGLINYKSIKNKKYFIK